MFAEISHEVVQPLFWLSLGKIVWIDVLLSGDNALVIAMACRNLAPRQRLWGMVLGALAAVAMRVGCTGVIASLMTLPYLKVAGGLALLCVATKMLMPEGDGDSHGKSADRLLAAIRMIVVADIIMSVDNVIAVAAAADGSLLLLGAGLAISIPLIVSGAALISGLLSRFPFLIWAGGALLGFIAGEVIATDPVVQPMLSPPFELPAFYGAMGAVTVLLISASLRKRGGYDVTAS